MQSSRRNRNAAIAAAALAVLLASPMLRDDEKDQATRATMRFLLDVEKLRLRVYDDGYGNKTTGAGHVVKPGDPERLTKAEALELLLADIEEHNKCIEKYRGVLKPWQFAALSSFVFNHGCKQWASPDNSVRNLLDAGLYDSVPDAMMRYVYATNKRTGKKEYSRGLERRRIKEIKLWKGETWLHYSERS